MKRKKLIIGSVILFIGGLIIVAVTNHEYCRKIIIDPYAEEKAKNIYQKSDIIIFDLKMDETPQYINVSFDIYNNTENTIEDGVLLLDFYDKDNLCYTAEIQINNLASGENLKITNKNIVFIYDEITKFTFSYLGNDIPVTELNKYLQEFKTIDANKITTISEDNFE